jgi:hypothetical protein
LLLAVEWLSYRVEIGTAFHSFVYVHHMVPHKAQ